MEEISQAKKDYEARQEEKRASKESNSGSSFNGKKISKWLILLLVLILVIWGLKIVIDKNTPQGKDYAVAYPDRGRDHIEPETASGLNPNVYSSNPPSSGPHYPTTAKSLFYDKAIEDQYAIHNLEHGDIWITYNPRITQEIKDKLKEFAGRYVIISPRNNNDYDISLVAWGVVDNFNLSPEINLEERVNDFILRYDNKGPEKVRSAASMN
jgi:hypothetical protein